jgi:ADP-heptose:LPS heptosyltransferase
VSSFKIAVVKPDHLGDFVLALPAIRTLQSRGYQITLFIASGTVKLARHYFPNIELVALDLPHLNRKLGIGDWTNAYRALGSLRAFDLVMFLRRDAFLKPSNFCQWTDRAVFVEERDDRHQSQLEYNIVSQITDVYDIESTFFAGRRVRFPEQLSHVVLSIGSGFPLKKWSPLSWAELGQRLVDSGIKVEILSGPMEIEESKLIARAIGIDDCNNIFVGTDNFSSLECWLDRTDLVIAVDGGPAHLCSTRKPIFGIFGPSPMRKYAPIGHTNRILTKDLSCSPCVGFDVGKVNACMSRECLYGLRPNHVVAGLGLPPVLPGQAWELDMQSGIKVAFGLSAW